MSPEDYKFLIYVDTNDKLELKFDPRTIEHLGIKMYSQLPYALAELVANAYDAGAENVRIKLYDNISSQKRIVVIDDGDGMSYEEVRDNFLVIGRRRRDTDESRENSKAIVRVSDWGCTLKNLSHFPLQI